MTKLYYLRALRSVPIFLIYEVSCESEHGHHNDVFLGELNAIESFGYELIINFRLQNNRIINNLLRSIWSTKDEL